MKSWGNLTEKNLMACTYIMYTRRFINILPAISIITLALTGFAAWLIYGLGWEVIPAFVQRDVIDWIGVDFTLLDNYNIIYQYPAHYYLTHGWIYSKQISIFPGLVFIATSILAGSLINAAVIRVAGQHMAGQRVGIGITHLSSLRRLGRYVLVNSLFWLLTVALIVSFAGIPLAVYIGFKWMFAGHAILLEDASIKGAVKRSTILFRGNWLRSAFFILMIPLISILVAGSMAFIPSWGSTAAIILTIPLPAMLITLYYIVLRVEKEGSTEEQLTIDMNAWTKGQTPVYPGKTESDEERAEREENWDEFWEKRPIPKQP